MGDMSGVVQCFRVKKGEVVVSFKSLPGPQKVGDRGQPRGLAGRCGGDQAAAWHARFVLSCQAPGYTPVAAACSSTQLHATWMYFLDTACLCR